MKSKILILIMIGTLACFLCGEPLWAVETEKNLEFAGQWPYHPAKGIALDLERDFIFLGDGDRVTILTEDLKQVSSFQVTATSQVGGLFYSEADQLLFVACRTDGLKIFDVSNIKNPNLSGAWIPKFFIEIDGNGELQDTTETLGLCVVDSIAYLCCGIDGLIIAEISDLANPEVLSSSRLPGGYGLSYAMNIHVTGNYAFAADLYNGIHIINISDPKNPDYKKGIILAGASDLYASENYLYATLQGNGLAIMDISIPEETAVTAVYKAGTIETAVTVYENTAWVSYNPDGLFAIDVSDKKAPGHNTESQYNASGSSSLGMFPADNFIYMAGYQLGLEKIDITDKTNMTRQALYDTPSDAVAIDISGNYLYAVDDIAGSKPESEGLRIHRLEAYSHSVQFEYKGFCATPGTALDIQVLRSYAYIADGEQGLQVINISDPLNPEIVGNCDTPGTASGLFADDNYAYVADGHSGLVIINITDKTKPVITAALDTDGFTKKIMVSNNTVYLADGDSGVKLIDISNKTNPLLIGSCDTPGTASGIYLNGNYIYTADGEQGLAVIDITNPSAPNISASLATGGYAYNVMISGNIAYVADGPNGLFAADITNPLEPTPIPDWSYNSPGTSVDVLSGYSNEAEEFYTFIADGAAGVVAVNLSIIDADDGNDNSGKSSSGGCFIETSKK